jgi:hypothetical protein
VSTSNTCISPPALGQRNWEVYWIVSNPVGRVSGFDPEEPPAPKHVIRGGSFLCSEAFCFSYRPAARMKLSPDSPYPMSASGSSKVKQS